MSDKQSDQEKTEDPTQKRREKAREEGQVAISTEISSVMIMVVSVMTVVGMGGFMYGRVEALFETFFLNAQMPVENQNHAAIYLGIAFRHGIEAMTPILIALIATALVVNLIQTKGAFSLKAIKFKPEKLNPITGIQNIFSMKGFVELAKGLFKLLIMGIIVYFTVFPNMEHFVSFSVMPLEYNISEAGSYVLLFLTRTFVALTILAIVDAIYQQYQHKEDLKMSKKEVKDEHKESEGDPQMKNKRKQMGRSFMSKRLDHAVMDSDVVVTNPTHYAIALQYDPEKNNAPLVMAKGQRLRAQKIKEYAKEFDIPIVENKPVAQALFASAEVDQHIPEDLYRAVAEILAYVYKLKNKHNI
ncbi:flagellar biosynthesis protein FlhB [Aliifodinibius salipaludis]|uniref:Flagellar biosynthetic protein FlhB n=1 Tax=Fodinibius salipaludis TaxID=2032627 RepID=A0A2A2GCM5_9BACT|nr:flagellar biosynthesis protein FlhB [Aliifodinibius salipaludis]PAU94605.1 flagellar biosynthesis protein FlhB [Aliifodinibius salipaludis]